MRTSIVNSPFQVVRLFALVRSSIRTRRVRSATVPRAQLQPHVLGRRLRHTTRTLNTIEGLLSQTDLLVDWRPVCLSLFFL